MGDRVRGEYLKNNTLVVDGKWTRKVVMKKGMIVQKNDDSPFVLLADPKVAKLLPGLCWCCGRPRINLHFDRGWEETCVYSKLKGETVNFCKYLSRKGCKAKGKKDGRCRGRCDDSK